MSEARGPASIRRHRSCPAARCPGHRPVSATPGGWMSSQAQERGQPVSAPNPPCSARRVSHTRNDPNIAMEERKCQMSWSSKKSRRMQSRLCSLDSAGVFWAETGRAACGPAPSPSRALPGPSPRWQSTFFLLHPLSSSPTSKNWLLLQISPALPSPFFHSDPPPLRFFFP